MSPRYIVEVRADRKQGGEMTPWHLLSQDEGHEHENGGRNFEKHLSWKPPQT